MGLRERILYGNDKEFGSWFHQQCTWIKNNALVATKSFRNRHVVEQIDVRNAAQIDELIGNYISAVFILYLVFIISADKGEDYLLKRLTPIAGIISTVFGSHTLSLYEAGMKHISERGVGPESSVAHLLVDPLEIPLNHESRSLEVAFDFFHESFEEYYAPALQNAYAHNSTALKSVLEAFGHGNA